MSAAPGLTSTSPAAQARRGDTTGERWALTGGRVLQLRPLVPEDAAAERAFFNGLSLDSRVLRFHFGLRELSPNLLKLLTEVDQRLHRAWVLALPGPENAIVADARFVVDSAKPGSAEFALAVADAWQGRGLGRRLMAHLIAEARGQGLRELSGDVLADNRRMLALLRDLGVRLLGHPDGPQLIRAEMTLN